MVPDTPREQFSDRLIVDPALDTTMCDHRPDDGDGPAGDGPAARGHAPVGRRDPLSELLSGLARRRRREVLYYLVEHEPVDLESVAGQIARRERGADPEAVRIDLVHNHLPKLADRGLIEYDPRSGAIGLIDLEDRFVALLERCRALESEER